MKKLNLTILSLLFISLQCYSQETGSSGLGNTIIKNGIGMGSVIAIVISWDRRPTLSCNILCFVSRKMES